MMKKYFAFLLALLFSFPFSLAQAQRVDKKNQRVDMFPIWSTGLPQYFRALSCHGEGKCEDYLNVIVNVIHFKLGKRLENLRLPRGRYETSIRLKLNKKGDVRFVMLHESSGSSEFDRAVIHSAYDAENFGKLPWSLKKAAKKGDLIFSFGAVSR